ncbi:hypothetical protein XCV0262 [Xanthomonas euvesicatoria pv. vesicatoria str. 85-10]|uniref:Uncharacterized protein n=1 Tax=Xanthomonas euvesicatoria pv. vesicatoria (strain 85-10) TaxID=316273 RepID=Q3BZ20_XANE5|nr:hypothetical protein XCV0262 [Xanthomonas euvesicatoria pv. vesicatoria str. 85-10]
MCAVQQCERTRQDAVTCIGPSTPHVRTHCLRALIANLIAARRHAYTKRRRAAHRRAVGWGKLADALQDARLS